jgi:HK97 family phage prohead protease
MLANPIDAILAQLESGIAIDHGYTESDASVALLQVIASNTGLTIPDSHTTSDRKTGIEYKKAPENPTVEKNTLYGYAAWHYGADGDYYVDPYGDITVPGSWQDTIKEAETTKHNTGRDWLLPHMYNHDKNSLVGAVVKLQEDARGVYYETRLANTPRAREVKSLASDGLLGASYGYNPLVVQHVYHEKSKKMVRKLVKVNVAEISATCVPANPYSSVGVKSFNPLLQASGHQGHLYNANNTLTMKRLCNQIDDALTKLQLEVLSSTLYNLGGEIRHKASFRVR